MNILRTIKYLLCIAVLAAGLPAAYGYSFNGPVANADDSYQTPTIGYDPDSSIPNGTIMVGNTSITIPGINTTLSMGPKNISDEYRPNLPVWYYTYDSTFVTYYGSNAMASINQAFDIMNNSFTYTNSIATNSIGVDGFSQSMMEFPDFSQHLNTTAYGLDLSDMKSVMLNSLMYQMGLQMPERFVWTLEDAYLPAGGVCPLDEEFRVVQRNYGLLPSPADQIQYSSYINDELYTFYIFFWDSPPTAPCAIPPGNGNDQFRTVPYPVNPFDNLFTTVASGDEPVGTFYTGLTRDDLAGLRSLLSTNTQVYENPAAGATLIATNGIQFLTTSNLYTLLNFAQTNDPGVTASTFGVTVTSTNIGFGYVTNWNFFLTTPYGQPAGTQVLSSNIASIVPVEFFTNTYGNVITNGNVANVPLIVQDCTNVVLNYSPVTHAQLQTISFQTSYGQPAGSGTATTNLQPITLNVQSGEYFTVPPGDCGFEFLCQAPGYTLTTTTNVIGAATNFSTGFVGSESIITTVTNHIYVVRPIVCNAPTSPGVYQGIGKVNFVEADYDSLLSQTYQPITNRYSMNEIVGGQVVRLNFQRIVTAPDWLIQAADISGQLPFFNATAMNTPNFVHDPGNANNAGPGIINPPVAFTYNKVGDIFLNGSLATYGLSTNDFNPFNENSQSASGVVWGSFDATTNPPEVYPSGTSLLNLEYEVLIRVSPTPPYLSAGTNGVPYPATTFSASGGGFTKSYTWSAAGLPSGLTLMTNPDSTATLSGTPMQSGTFDFTVQLTDYNGRSVTWNYTLTIN